MKQSLLKKSVLILALPLMQVAASSAFAAAHSAAPAAPAASATPATAPTPATSAMPKSRAEVKAETKAATTTSATKPGEVGSPATVDSTKVAAPVGDAMKNEAAAAQAVDQKQTSTKSRGEVKAEAKMANQKEVHRQKGDNLTTGK